MAITTHYTQEQRNHQAERIGALFDLPDAGMKMTREGWSMESWGGGVMLKIELVKTITPEEAEAILNATPITKDDQ